jgi:futalosine hydrolase
MKLLIVAATEVEIAPLLEVLHADWSHKPDGRFFQGNCEVEIGISGIGMHRMSYLLGSTFAISKPDLCINAGIAGAFPGKAEIGEVVHVVSERIVDLGAEDSDGAFLTPGDLGLTEDLSSISDLVNSGAGKYQFLRTVSGITANTTHGHEPSIDTLLKTYDPDVESMEGGAFFYCCLKSKVPFIEIRAISNIVATRNREAWNIPHAVGNLTLELQPILQFFSGV